MIALFATHESRDELGIGQIRDVLSDSMFPGTSVLHTRPRYHLIVPWVFQHAARQGRSGTELRIRANTLERRLIERIRDAGAADGLIGRVAGKRVKVLPSAIYWSGLRTYRILASDRSQDTLAGAVRTQVEEADELTDRHIADWDATLPPPPNGFPDDLDGGLDIRRDEAEWLRDRIRSSAPQTLLSHFLTTDHRVDPTSWAPWTDPAAYSAPAEVRRLTQHAELFSRAIQGAALLYNLQIGERYEQAGYTRVDQPVEAFREQYANWVEDVQDHDDALAQWDREDFWRQCLTRNPRISTRTRWFVREWIDAVVDGRADQGVDDESLRRLVGERERLIKRSQSRLVNDKLLGAWSGESGSARLTYRWLQVRRMLLDMQRAWSDDARA